MAPLLLHAKAEISEWQDLGGGKARLVSIVDPGSNQLFGAVEVQLNPGWTTYWRSPGESGIPPEFDFSKSRGIHVDKPKFPAPEAKYTSGILSYVYEDRVLFPFEGAFSARPNSSALNLDLLIGVCEVVCIPAQATFSLKFTKSGSDPLAMRLIEEAKTALPLPSLGNDEFAIQSAKLSADTTIEVTTKAAKNLGDALLLTEGRPNWYFPPGKLIRQFEDKAIFSVTLKDLPENIKLHEEKLRFTLVTDTGSFESELTIK